MTGARMSAPERRSQDGAVTSEALSDAALRDQAYGLLANVLTAPPSAELLHLLGPVEGPAESPETALGQAWHLLELASERADTSALDDEFHDLFIGIGRGELMPYASWYLTGFLMEKPLAELRATLAALGLERQAEVHEPEDHAAALCETMRMLIAGSPASESDQPDLGPQRQFFQDYIAPWMAQFFADMQRARAARFYRAVGQFGERFVDFERQYFAMTA